MMQAFIVVVDKLYKRKVIPLKLPDDKNVVGVVNRGCVVKAKQVTVSKGANASMGKWYRDSDGYYYWGGGLIKK